MVARKPAPVPVDGLVKLEPLIFVKFRPLICTELSAENEKYIFVALIFPPATGCQLPDVI